MKRVWQTIDGAIFSDELDAKKHENQIVTEVMMWDKNGEPTTETDAAMIVHLTSPTSYDTFISICKAQEGLMPTLEEMGEGDMGWWFWSSIVETYFPLEFDEIKLIAKIASFKY